MKLLRQFIDLFLGKHIETLQVNGKKQSEMINMLEASLDGEDGWMLENKLKDETVKYNCNCKEVK